jgi:hypothetical protein
MMIAMAGTNLGHAMRVIIGWVLSAAAVVVVLWLALMPLDVVQLPSWLPWPRLPFGPPDKYEAYGTWLQGALTPALVIIGLLGWRYQKAGQDEANKIQMQTLIPAHVHEFYGRINYMARWRRHCRSS